VDNSLQSLINGDVTSAPMGLGCSPFAYAKDVYLRAALWILDAQIILGPEGCFGTALVILF